VTVTATLALTDPLVAVIVLVPTLAATSCGPLMTATAGLELVQTTDAPAITCPSRAVAVDVNVVVVPEVTVNAIDGAMVIETGALSGAVVPPEPESPPQLAAAIDDTNTMTTDRSTCTRRRAGGCWMLIAGCWLPVVNQSLVASNQ
jgi:hypothetical protein